MLFNDNIKFYGKHAKYIKKYTDNNEPFIVSSEGEAKNIYLFKNAYDIVEIAIMIGIIDRKTALEDSENTNYDITIFHAQLSSQEEIFNRIIAFMVLQEDGIDIEQRIKLSFSIEKKESLKERLWGYMRYGLEKINSIFEKCKSYEDVANGIYELIGMYSLESFLDGD